MSAQEKQMEVCEVCGAFLIIGDAQTRVDDHLQGKQHMGYAKIKSTIEELKVQCDCSTLMIWQISNASYNYCFHLLTSPDSWIKPLTVFLRWLPYSLTIAHVLRTKAHESNWRVLEGKHLFFGFF